MEEIGCFSGKALHGISKQSMESLTEDVVLKTREYAQSNAIRKRRHIVRMILNEATANRTLREQYKWQLILQVDGRRKVTAVLQDVERHYNWGGSAI